MTFVRIPGPQAQTSLDSDAARILMDQHRLLMRRLRGMVGQPRTIERVTLEEQLRKVETLLRVIESGQHVVAALDIVELK